MSTTMSADLLSKEAKHAENSLKSNEGEKAKGKSCEAKGRPPPPHHMLTPLCPFTPSPANRVASSRPLRLYTHTTISLAAEGSDLAK